MKSPVSHNTTASNAQSSFRMTFLCPVLNILSDTTRRTLRYGHIGRVKFISDGARLSKNQRTRLRNLSVPQGWVGIINAWLQLSQKMTLPCRSPSLILCSLISIVTPISGGDYFSIQCRTRNTLIDSCTKKIMYSCG